jgi:hypothetical protein
MAVPLFFAFTLSPSFTPLALRYPPIDNRPYRRRLTEPMNRPERYQYIRLSVLLFMAEGSQRI